jgi:hypothetical protein
MLNRISYVAFAIVALLVSSLPARAQGCIMCYESALATGKGVQDALRSGVLVLLIPVALLLIILAVLVWRSGVVQAARAPKHVAAD